MTQVNTTQPRLSSYLLDTTLVLLCYKLEQVSVELFYGIRLVGGRPATEAFIGIP
jgi:hypothetical protein